MNAGLIILRVAFLEREYATRRMSATELVCAAAQLRRSSDSVADSSQQHYNLALSCTGSAATATLPVHAARRRESWSNQVRKMEASPRKHSSSDGD